MFAIRFSLLHAFIGVTAAAFLIATLSFSGGYLVYPPLLVLFILGVLTARQAVNAFSKPKRSTGREHLKLALCTVLFTSAATLYLPLFGYATKWFANKRTIQIHRNRILKIDDPESVRLAGRQLHSRLIALPRGQRVIRGDAGEVPPELARLEPVWISASETGLGMLLYRNYETSFGLYIFPENPAEEIGDVEIIDGLWLWEIK
ncbi:MAG: hypothetical protein KY475_23110 [Planctomycetes bacterium]|nr:hypothetical protein [Planctomycetota bacterium]